MRQVLVDTNIMLDLLTEREPFLRDATLLFSRSHAGRDELIVSALSIANSHYLLAKSVGDLRAKEALRAFKVLVKVLPLTDRIIELALNDSGFKDFEDAQQYYTALEHNLEIIVTRNQKDFKTAKLPVMDAKAFLALKA